MKRRRGRPTAASDVVAKLLRHTHERPGQAEGARALGIFAAFSRIGPPVTEHAEPVLFRRGVLTLQVAQSAWLTELSFLEERIRRRVNAAVGRDAVRAIRFRLGPLADRPPPPPPPRPVSDADRARIAGWADAIPNEQVREAVTRAAERFAARGPVAEVDVSGPAGPRPAPAPAPVAEPPPLKYGFGAGGRDRWKDPRKKKR